MVKQIKLSAVEELKTKFSENNIAYFVDYQGLTVGKATALRASLKNVNAEMKVYKNTLALLAIKEIKGDVAENAEKVLVGNTAIIFANIDPVASAKTILDFARENGEAVKVKGGILDKTYLEPGSVKEIATLPSKEILIAKLLMLLNSPVSGLVNVLQGNIRNFVYALNSIAEKKSS